MSKKKPNEIISIDFCHTIQPNHIDHFQEITVVARRMCNGEDITIIFTPEDWLDTFTPTIYKHVKEHYIKYIEQKE